MVAFQNQVELSDSVLLEYDNLPKDEYCYEIWCYKEECSFIKRARVNGEEAKLFSAVNIPCLIESIINEYPGFLAFRNLRDIVLPDIEITMYYMSNYSYSSTCEWMKAIIQQLIRQGEIIAFSQSKLVVVEAEGIMNNDEDIVFAVKCALTPINQGVIDEIVSEALLSCECYSICLNNSGVNLETEILDCLNIGEALKTANDLPELIYRTLSFFSQSTNPEPFSVFVMNKAGKKVIEMDVKPAAEASYSKHYEVKSYISDEASEPERRFILAAKKALAWGCRDISEKRL